VIKAVGVYVGGGGHGKGCMQKWASDKGSGCVYGKRAGPTCTRRCLLLKSEIALADSRINRSF
jgi:hypothetical protein